jgi:ABC-type glycerol-3-phosphate transport system substrate-binding protein
MRRAALACALAAVALGVAGCGGGGSKQTESEAANPQAKAACDGSPLSGTPNLPASFPMVENTTLTKQSKQGPTDLVQGYWKGELKEAHDEYVKEFEAAGYDVLFEELEDHDSEVSWKGEGRTGQVALRDQCGGDKIYVHITNRPA